MVQKKDDFWRDVAKFFHNITNKAIVFTHNYAIDYTINGYSSHIRRIWGHEVGSPFPAAATTGGHLEQVVRVAIVVVNEEDT